MERYKGIIFFMAAIAASLVLTFSCSSRRTEPVKQVAFSPGKASVLNGEKMFMMHCHKCHPAGEAGLGPAVNSNPAPQFVKRFQVRHGLGVMPGFKTSEISRDDLRDISSYMKSWKKY